MTKTTQFQLRLTPEELDRWKQVAGEEGVSAFVRRVVNGYVDAPKVPPQKDVEVFSPRVFTVADAQPRDIPARTVKRTFKPDFK
jgi:hypothetical protein